MTCATHNWMFTIPCPRCAAAGVSAIGAKHARQRRPVATEPKRDSPDGPRPVDPVVAHLPHTALQTEPYVEPSLPAVTGDEWEIPAYLLRRQDGGFKYPSLHGDKNEHVGKPAVDGRPVVSNRGGVGLGYPTSSLKFWPDDKLLTALSDHTISVIDRQPVLEEAKKRHDQVKGYERQRPFL